MFSTIKNNWMTFVRTIAMTVVVCFLTTDVFASLTGGLTPFPAKRGQAPFELPSGLGNVEEVWEASERAGVNLAPQDPGTRYVGARFFEPGTGVPGTGVGEPNVPCPVLK